MSADEIVPYATEYESVWIDSGEHKSGTFYITNPHTIINNTQGTFKIESEYSNASAQLILHTGIAPLANKLIYARNGDVRFEFKSNVKDLAIMYFTRNISSKYGMRIMCWLW